MGAAATFLALRFADGVAVDPVATAERLSHEAALAALAETRSTAHEASSRHKSAVDRLVAAQAQLSATERRLAEVEANLAVLSRESGEAEAVRQRLAGVVEAQRAEIDRLGAALGTAESRREGLAVSIEQVGVALDSVIAERDALREANDTLSDRTALLEAAVLVAEAREAALLADLEAATALGLARLEKVFSEAEIDLDRVLPIIEADYSGQGGPLEPVAEAGEEIVEGPRVAALLDDLERVSLMRFAAERVPFALPVEGGRLTSGFGYRRDPFRRTRSMHRGIDIAAPRGTPVLATAAGVVTFVGWQRGYGRVVEIRHAFGFETLYAHLDRARVTLGQRVSTGDLIGDMGSTGRSTGNHVHYEVQLDGAAVNPLKFIEAARDVL